MNPRYAAAGLASLGRRGDSTLVHMAPREVAALDRLGAKYGRRVTRNPDTGLPEAFSFVDLLPMAAGLITAPFLGPIGAALASGVTAGAKTAAQGGSLGDVAMSAGISGLGSYAGSGILGAGSDAALSAANSAAAAANPIAETAATEAAINPVSLGEAGRLQAQGATVPGFGGEVAPSSASPTIAQSTWDKGIANIQSIPDKISNAFSQPEAFAKGAFNYVKENPMMGVAAGANLLGMGNYTPPQQPTTSQKPTLRPGFGQSWQQTYNPMPEGYNPGLQGPWDYGFTYNPPVVPGPLNAASGGEVKGMAEGGMASIDPVNLDPLSRLSQNIAQNRNTNWGADANWGLTAPNQSSGSLATALSSATQPSLTSGSTLSPGVPTVPGVPGVGGSPGASPIAQNPAASMGTMEASGSGEGADTGEADANASYGGGTDVFARGGAIRRYFDGGYIRRFAEGGNTRNALTNAQNNTSIPTTYTPMPEGYNPALQGVWDYNFQTGANPVNATATTMANQSSSRGGNYRQATDAQREMLFRGISPYNYDKEIDRIMAWPRAFAGYGFGPFNRASTLQQNTTNNPMNFNPMPEGYNPAIQGAWDYNFQPMTSGPMNMADGGVVGMSHDVPGISGFPPDAPGLNAYRNMARGGGVSTRNTVSEAIRALSGEHPDADGALKNFSDTFGPGALAALKNKYGGGRIRGPGGGLDDLVGGTIEGKQEVRLADGEFVVPADVVSGLGGGSTDKGVHELKNMMSRIRKGATGKTTQINRVNPRKVLPA